MNRMFLFFIIAAIIVLTSCKKDVNVSSPDTNIDLYEISMTSNPSGAMIFIDGKNSGYTTPAVIKYLEKGEYSVLLKYPYFLEYKDTINIKENTSKNYNFFDLKNVYGQLEISGITLGGDILYDSIYIGKTPLTVSGLIPGTHKVEISRFDHISKTYPIEIFSNQKTRIYCSLTDTSEWVNYNDIYTDSPYKSIYKIIQNSSNNFLLSTNAGIVYFNKKSFVEFVDYQPFKNSSINMSFKASDGSIWFACKNGLYVLEGNNWRHYNSKNSVIPTDYFTGVTEWNGAIYCTTNNGLYKYFSGQWTGINTQNSPLDNNFLSTIGVHDNKLYVSTLINSTFLITKDNVWTKFDVTQLGGMGAKLIVNKNTKESFVVNTVQRGPTGAIIIPEELYTFDGLTYKKFDYKFSRAISFNSFNYDNNGDLWIGTNLGIHIFDKNLKLKDILIIYNTKLISNSVNDIFFDSKWNVYLATEGGGLSYYKRNK